jgi:hypothetical protein
MANSFNLKVYGTQRGDVIAAETSYPTIAVSDTAVAAVEPYVNATLSITNGSKVILKASNVNGGLPTAYLSNTVFATVVSDWNTD